MKTMEIDEAEQRLDEIADAFEAGGHEPIILTRDGFPAAMLLPPESEAA